MAKKSRTREARQRRQNQRRQNQRLIVLALIVVVAVVGIAVLVVSNQPVDADIPEELSLPYEGIERSYSREGYPRLGNADAPVTMEEYASFACPGCESFHSESLDAVLERVKSGQVLFTYVPLNTGSIPNAPGASRAALCAGQQGLFWEMHDVLFDWQTRYGNTAFSQNRLLTGVEKLDLNSSAFTACFNSAEISETLDAAASESISTTPTLRVNGVTVEPSQAGTIPSAATILQAIDDASPADWGQRVEAGGTDQEAAAEEPEAAPMPEAEATAALADEQTDDSEEETAEDPTAEDEADSAGDTVTEATQAPEPVDADGQLEEAAVESEAPVDDSEDASG